VDVGKNSNRIVTVYGIPSTEIWISLYLLFLGMNLKVIVWPSGIMKPNRAETNPEDINTTDNLGGTDT
jgi:hypothetical protein